MLTTLQIVALVALGLLALYTARTSRTLYWGRASKALPITPLQQKIIGYVWSISLLTIAGLILVGALLPGKIESARSQALTTVILGSAAIFSIAVALLDNRTTSQAKSSLFGRFAIGFMWILVATWTAVLVHEFWIGVVR
jgi:hypothetical protein